MHQRLLIITCLLVLGALCACSSSNSPSPHTDNQSSSSGGDDGSSSGGDDGSSSGGDDGSSSGGDDGSSSGGDDGSSSGGDTHIPLVPGAATIDTSAIATGYVSVSFPDANGDGPTITAATINGHAVLAAVSGSEPVPFATQTAPALANGLRAYLPIRRDYTLTLTIADDGDNPQNLSITIDDATLGSTFTFAGTIADGLVHQEVGQNTRITLHWQPFATQASQLLSSMDSDGSQSGLAIGDYQFTDLLGSPSQFTIDIAGGTLD